MHLLDVIIIILHVGGGGGGIGITLSVGPSVCLSVLLSMQSCPVHVLLMHMETQWTFLLHIKIAYDLEGVSAT